MHPRRARHPAGAVASAAALALITVAAFAAPARAAEREPRLPAAELANPALLAGPGYVVEPQARLHGFQARFTIRTDWGVIEAESVEMLGLRIQEMPAVQAIHEASVSGVLADVAAQGGVGPARSLWNVATRPVESVVGIPRGVGRYFRETWTKWRDRGRKLDHRFEQAIWHDGDPTDSADAAMAAHREAEVREGVEALGPAEGQDDAWYDRPARELTRAVRGEIGYGNTRRRIAQRLGVDPYTSNPLIRERLDRLAWAAAIGRLGTDRLWSVITAGASDVLGPAGRIDALVLSEAPADLRARNEAILRERVLDRELRYVFLYRSALSPTQQVRLVDLLEGFDPASGAEALLETALMADNELEARFVVNALEMIQAHYGESARGGDFVPRGATLAYRLPNGELVLPMPLDRLSWTRNMARWFDQPGIGDQRWRTVLLAGTASELAERELTARGWSIVQRQPWPGSPPYAHGLSFAPPAPLPAAPAQGASPR